MDGPILDLVGSEDVIFATGFSGRVSSVNKRKGTINWSYNTDSQVAGLPQVRDGNYYLFSRLGNVYGFKFQ